MTVREYAKTRALQEPDVVTAARSVVQLERRLVWRWAVCLLAGAAVAVAAMVARMPQLAYALSALVSVATVAITVIVMRNQEAAKARALLETWDRLATDNLEIDVDEGPTTQDPRWDRALEHLATIRTAGGGDEVLRGARARLRSGFDRLGVLADALALDGRVSGAAHPRLVAAREEIDESVAARVDALERAAEVAGRDMDAALALLIAGTSPQKNRPS